MKTDPHVRQRIDRYIQDHLDDCIADLTQLCRQPSVSATGEGIEGCARLVAEMLAARGLAAEIAPTNGNPVVLGQAPGASEKTLLLYLHYDVQPADPLDLWRYPPFGLTQQDGRLYGRGAADDKGHIITRLAALDAVRHALGELPCAVKFVIEGEEEIGSPNLAHFVRANKERLAADACIWETGGVDVEGAATQILGLRGICYVELAVETAKQNTHSGLGGSVWRNAAWRLTWALSTLKNLDERILIPGFYDNVQPASERDLALLAKLPDPRPSLQEAYGLAGFVGPARTVAEYHRQAVFEPTCTICGLTSGAQGPGTMTIIPGRASAKVDFRLVPDQTPDEILAKLRVHLDAQGFSDVQIKSSGSTLPARTDPDHPFVHLAAQMAEEVYGRPPAIQPLIGGSGPNHLFVHDLGLPVVTAGVHYPGSQIHAPDEHIRLQDFVLGIRHTAYILEAFGRS